jgi:hypothetical protein
VGREPERGEKDGEEESERKLLDLERDEPDPPPDEVTLDRDQALRDLRELQELSIERASGRSSDDA